MSNTKDLIIAICGVVFGGIILYYFFGIPPQPTQIPNSEQSQTNQPLYTQDLVSIDNLISEKPIYSLGENLSATFTITSKLNTSYNFTVYWLAETKKINFTWSNSSNKTASWTVWYFPADKIGNWYAQVIVDWKYQNFSFQKVTATNFKVVA